MTPKVMIVTTEAPDLGAGGLCFFNGLLWQELRTRGYPCITVYLNRYGTPHSQAANYTVPVTADLPFDQMQEVTAMNTAWSTREKLQPIFDQFQPDVISVHGDWAVMPFFFDLPKVQFTWHASHIGMNDATRRTPNGLHSYTEQRIAAMQSGALVLHSDWAKQQVKLQLTDEKTEAIAPAHVFPIGVRFEDYPTTKIRHPSGKIIVSFFARYNDEAKNFSAFNDALQRLTPDLRSRIEVRLYGAGDLPAEFQNSGLQVLGYATGQAKRDVLAQADIVVMPSTKESFGIIGLEALMSNCHLIATPGLGMDAYLPAECACLPDASSLADHLSACIINIDSIRAKQDASYYRKMVEKSQFSVQGMTDSYIAVWQSMMVVAE